MCVCGGGGSGGAVDHDDCSVLYKEKHNFG